jgi:hypothetical protein
MDTLTADAIIPAVTMLCEPSTDHTKFAGAVALDRLARDSVYLAAVVDAGAIPALVAALTVRRHIHYLHGQLGGGTWLVRALKSNG